VLTVLHGIGVSIYSCVIVYETESILKGLSWMFAVIRQYDMRTWCTLHEPNNLGRYSPYGSCFDYCFSCFQEDEELIYYMDRAGLNA